MKKRCFLCVCLLAMASFPVLAQTGGPDVVVVSLSYGRTVFTIKAVITREAGKSEVVEIPAGGSEEKKIATSQGYQSLISKLYQQGYSIKSTFTLEGNGATTLVFVKGQ